MTVRMFDINIKCKRKHVDGFGLRQETAQEVQARRDALKTIPDHERVSGIKIVESTDNVELYSFVGGLSEEWVMVDAFVRALHREHNTPTVLRRRRGGLNAGPNPNEDVKAIFRFVHRDFLDEDAQPIEETYSALAEMVEGSTRRLEVWENPFFEDQRPVDGQKMVSINTVGRSLLFDQNGEPYGEWVLDPIAGEENEKEYRAPEYQLLLEDNQFMLEQVDYEDYVCRVMNWDTQQYEGHVARIKRLVKENPERVRKVFSS